MNLHVHNTFDPVTQKITTAGVAPYIWDDADSHANYTKPTDFTTIDIMIETAPDYKVGRDYMKLVLLTHGTDEEDAFNNIQTNDKPICAKHKLGTVDQRITALGQPTNVACMLDYLSKTVASRTVRGALANCIIQNELPDDKITILGIAEDLFEDYKDYGIEGIDRGDVVAGIDDYINSKNGYEAGTGNGNGLSIQSYTPKTMTLADLCSKLTDLMMNGNYNVYS